MSPTRQESAQAQTGTAMKTFIRVAFLLLLAWAPRAEAAPAWTEFPLPEGSGPHDVAPAPDGTVWFTAQAAGALGRLDPGSGHVDEFPLGSGSAPHGVIVGPDGAPWVTDGGLNAILRVDPVSHAIHRYALPAARSRANLNTATFDKSGVLWFTGQGGIYGRVDPKADEVRVWDAPRGPGPYGITTTPDGAVYFASLAGSYIARIDPATGAATVIEPPTPRQGARRIWSELDWSSVGQRVPRWSACSFRPREKHLAILASARRQGRALRSVRRSARRRMGERLRTRHITSLRSIHRPV